MGQLAHIALPSVPSMPSVPNGLPWVIGENHVACWVSMDSIRHLESKYQIQNGCLIYLMPSPCPANAQSAQWAISGRYVTYWISMDSIHHWESKLTLFYVVHSFFFFFLGFPARFSRFPYLHACGDWWSLFTFHTNWFGFSVHKYTFNTQYTLKHFFLLMSQSFSVHFIRSFYHQCLQHRLIWNT